MHVAIMMSGIQRWAAMRTVPGAAGYVAGARAMRASVEIAARSGIETLTLYATSTTDRACTPEERDAVMRMLGAYLFTDLRLCVEQSVAIVVVGSRTDLSRPLIQTIEGSERLSAAGARMRLRLVFDYSCHDRLIQAASQRDRTAVSSAPEGRKCPGSEASPGCLSPMDFHWRLAQADPSALPAGAVDLLIRPAGDWHPGDFMKWEVAYAEQHLADCPWPDFDARRFKLALDHYARTQHPANGSSLPA